MLVVRAALAGKSLPASQRVLAAPACQSWRRLALRARRRWRGRCAPGACGEPDLRLALRARRSAHGAARRGRCAPVCEAAQPLAAIAASRYALAAEGVGAARPGACGSLFAASRYALGAEGVGAARPGAYMLSPPDNLRALPLGGGDVEDIVRFALLETLGARRASRSCRGRGWGGVVQTSSCRERSGNACVLPQHVQCASARSAAGIGAPSPQARPIPRAFSACAPALRAGAVRTGRRCAPAAFSHEVNNARPSRVPPRRGGLQDYGPQTGSLVS